MIFIIVIILWAIIYFGLMVKQAPVISRRTAANANNVTNKFEPISKPTISKPTTKSPAQPTTGATKSIMKKNNGRSTGNSVKFAEIAQEQNVRHGRKYTKNIELNDTSHARLHSI